MARVNRLPGWILIIVFMALSLATPQNIVKAAPTMLIINRSFEINNSPPGEWTVDNWANNIRFNDESYTGSYSVELYSNYNYQSFQFGAVDSDGNFTISFWVHRYDVMNLIGWFALDYNDTSVYDGDYFYYSFTQNPADWEEFTFNIIGGTNTTTGRYIEGIAFFGNTNNKYYLDEVSVEYDAPPLPYPFTIYDGGLLDGDCGNWVFVSPKQYTFYMDYVGNPTNFQISFVDAALKSYSWWFNETNGDFYNDSPGDGISGSFIEHYALNATANRAIWKLKFNLPVADTLNVTLYGDIWDDDFGNSSSFTLDDAFNIYNLGGFNTITASGWAGRLYDVSTGYTTGDGFEIYAADSRTPFMIDDQPFGTRGTFGLFQYKADPRVELPDWDFDLQNGTRGFMELKADHIADGLPPYPLFVNINVTGEPSSLHVYSENITAYTPRAMAKFRRAITDEIVNSTCWILAHTDNTNVKIRLSDQNLYTKAGFEACAVEIKDLNLNYLDDLSHVISLYNMTVDTWYQLQQIVDIANDTQRVIVRDSALNILADTGTIPSYMEEANFLRYFSIIAADSGDLFAGCDFYLDELQIKSDFDGDYGGVVKSEMIFHRLTQWRQDFDFSIEEGSEYTKEAYADYGFIELGVDLMVKNQWVNNALWTRVNVTSSNIMNRNNYVKYEINWFEDDVLKRDDTLYGLFYGNAGADIGDSRKDATGWHFNIWLNRANASTVLAGRLNAEYYGMSDKAAWWGIFSSDWKPMLSDVDESTCYISIKTIDGDPASAKDVSLVRCWERVYRNNQSTFHYSIQNIREQNFQIAGSTMEGIDTPPITKTQTPTMPGGFLGSALAAVFKNIIGRLGDGLLWGGLMVWTSFAGFIEVMASYFGAQGWYAYVMASISNGMNTVTTASGYLLTVNAWIWSLITFIFTQFTSIIYWANTWVTMIWNTWGMVTGTYYGTTDIISEFQIGQFVMLVLICLPLIIVDRMSSRGIFPVIDEIKTVIGAGQWVVSYLSGLIDAFVNLVFRLIEAIPVIQ